MAADYISHRHDVLGLLKGVPRGQDIVQFRGIPFGKIPGRFRQSVLRTDLPHDPFDATQPGPICLQTVKIPFPKVWEGGLAADGIVLRNPESDELNCLNLNITTPTSSLRSGESLPVLVNIHGGGFVVGSSSLAVSGRELLDGYKLVQQSIALGRPMIFVSVNYRIGPLGLLASK